MSDSGAGSFVLDIEWDRPGLPPLVGPFKTQAEAHEWCTINVPNGSWEVRTLTWPYVRQRGRRG